MAIFSKKWFLWFFDKSAESADNNEKMLGKVVYNPIWPESIMKDTSITPILLKVNFRCHTPKKHTFWKIENLPFFENISFAGLKSKFLSTQQKLYMSPTHPINMSSIWLKFMKLEQSTFSRFFCPVTVPYFKNLWK